MLEWETFQQELKNKIKEIVSYSSKENSLAFYFERFRKVQNIKYYKDLDRIVFQRMYGWDPEQNETLKIRYWRCGQHLPINREEIILLGNALDVTPSEMEKMVTEILLEKNTVELNGNKEFLRKLAKRYLTFLDEERKEKLGIKGENPENYLRHIIYADIMDCLWIPEISQEWYHKNHYYSRNFSSECAKVFQDSSKVSRSAVQRILMVLLMPEINISVMNNCLEQMGYAPLSPYIKKKSGAYADLLFLWILEQFDEYRTNNPIEDLKIQKQMLKFLDYEVVVYMKELDEKKSSYNRERDRHILKDLRIMKFRSFGKEYK